MSRIGKQPIALPKGVKYTVQGKEVLVEGPSRTTARRDGWDGIDQLLGRTACDRIAVFVGNERLIGRMVRVVVDDASGVTLFGRVETTERVATSA